MGDGVTKRSIVAASLAGAWTAALSVALPALTWVAEQLLMISEEPRPAWLWPLAGVSVAVLAGIPAYLLAQFARSGVVRAVGRTWATGAGLLGLLGAARAIPIQHNELYLAVLAVLTFAAALLLRPGAAAQ